MITQTLLKEEDQLVVNESLKDFLSDKGYSLIRELGEGKTRKAYLAKFTSGLKEQLRVVKIPKDQFDQDSVCTKINLSKGDPNEKEVAISNILSHPNLVDVVDHLTFKNKNISVESYFQEAQSLEDLVNKVGPIKDTGILVNLFSQIADAVSYANNGVSSVLLRDIKPSNILVGSEGYTKLTDFQNAKKLTDIVELELPTRGGTAYTHPKLINSIVGGGFSSASRQSEVYAVGASLFYALTGENAFKYNVLEEEKGNHDLNIAGKEIKVSLKINGQTESFIESKQHNATLKKQLRKVPYKFRKVIRKSLIVDNEDAYTNINEFKSDLLKTKIPGVRDFLAKIHDSLKPMLIASALTFMGVVGFNFSNSHIEQNAANPTMHQILEAQRYADFSFENWSNAEDSLLFYEKLAPTFDDIRRHLPRIMENNPEDIRKIRNSSMAAQRVHRMDPRLTKALLYSTLLNGWDQETVNKNYPGSDEGRTPFSYVPNSFVRQINYSGLGSLPVTEDTFGAMGTMYLKASMTRQDNVADVFANYFNSNKDINTARIRTRSLNYFPSIENHSISIGYSNFLHPSRKKLVDTAVAMYMILDEEGNLDLENIPVVTRRSSNIFSTPLSLPSQLSY